MSHWQILWSHLPAGTFRSQITLYTCQTQKRLFCKPDKSLSHTILDIKHRSAGSSGYSRPSLGILPLKDFLSISSPYQVWLKSTSRITIPVTPIRSAVATPTILPVPMSAAIVVHKVANADTSPSPLPVPTFFFKNGPLLHVEILWSAVLSI